MKNIGLLIDKNENVTSAMMQIDKTGKKIVYVLDGNRLCGSLSDGDIRRFLLGGGKMTDKVSQAANTTPKFLFDTQRSGAMDYMLSNMIDSVPVVNENLEIIDVICKNEMVDISSVTLRDLVPDDMEKILDFFDQMAGDTRAMFNRGNVNRVRVIDYLEGRTDNEKHFCATVNVNGEEKIVGYTFLWETDKLVPWLGIAVHERWKGFRLGRVLLEHLDKYAISNGYGGLLLSTVPANIRAQSLYTNMGYEYFGNHVSGEFLYIKRYNVEK